MKKFLVLALLISYCFQTHARSSSFMMPRSVTHNATLELALDTYQIYRDPSAACSSYLFYATPFYMQSNNSKTISRYFLPNNNAVLDIQENGTGNVGSLWLDLVAPPGLFYSSTVSLNLTGKTAGCYLYAWFDLNDWYNGDWIQNPWLSISFAAMQVRHNLGVQEVLTDDNIYGTIPGINTGIEALNNPTWRYGKLSPHSLKQSGVDDIQIKLGTNYYYFNNTLRFGWYLVGTAPTGNRPKAHFLFEPLVGTKHGAFGFGLLGDYTCHVGKYGQASVLYDFKYRYLFAGKEMRSFDLAPNGDWSRYLLFVNQVATSVTFPAINDCTVPANITPGSQIEYWLALHYAYCQWNIEVGYNLWWRAKDSIKLLGSIPPNTGIYDLAGAVVHNPVSASRANISQAAIGPNKAPSDATFTPSQNLNPASGAQHAALSDSIYLAFSYNGVTRNEHPFLIGLGGGYEFGDRHALSNGWIWTKFGIMF